MSAKQIAATEAHAKAIIASGRAPHGSDRRRYKTVAYSARGMMECETDGGARDYIAVEQVATWRAE